MLARNVLIRSFWVGWKFFHSARKVAEWTNGITVSPGITIINGVFKSIADQRDIEPKTVTNRSVGTCSVLVKLIAAFWENNSLRTKIQL